MAAVPQNIGKIKKDSSNNVRFKNKMKSRTVYPLIQLLSHSLEEGKMELTHHAVTLLGTSLVVL